MFTHPLLTKLPPAKMTELVLSRRKLMEKIMQNVTARKLQNSFQATGDRMSVTPQQFGAQVGNQIKKAFGFASSLPDAMKQAAVMLPAAGIGAGLGAATSPSGHRMEGLGRGAVKGTATGAGIMAGAPVGALGMLGLSLAMPGVGKKLFGPSTRQLDNFIKHLARKGKLYKARRPGHIRPEKKLELMNTLLGGAAVGAPLGGAAGYGAANAVMGAPSWEGKTASLPEAPTLSPGDHLGIKMLGDRAAGNKLVAGEKKLAPHAAGGVSMFGVLPGLGGNLGRNLGGK